MAKGVSVPWADNIGRHLPGVRVGSTTFTPRNKSPSVTAEAIQSENLAGAVAYFGGEESLLEYLSQSVTAWFKTRAVNRIRKASPEAAVESAAAGLIRAFVKRHGREPDASEMEKIRAKARALVLEF